MVTQILKKHWKISLTVMAVAVLGMAGWWEMAPPGTSDRAGFSGQWQRNRIASP
jgi:hypothetical protein